MGGPQSGVDLKGSDKGKGIWGEDNAKYKMVGDKTTTLRHPIVTSVLNSYRSLHKPLRGSLVEGRDGNRYSVFSKGNGGGDLNNEVYTATSQKKPNGATVNGREVEGMEGSTGSSNSAND
ncbi:hypothetical protein L6452_22922 [Arctium lappa]|uniref:Uncharacterized protein n=1 Tax=Arctium lappa TaxID=4217 RepID=A0ACB9B2E3_ARCLA|nr:hypothetical protein L6452_22922 [Arctium lappa]